MILTTYKDRERLTVSVPEGEVDGLKVERFEVKAYDLWNLRAAREGRQTRPGMYTRLMDFKEENLDLGLHPQIWMSDTDAEKGDHTEAVAAMALAKAERVLVNGLGLGMVVAAALTFDHVQHVDVVEADERVIKLVGPHYEKDPRVNIIHSDAFQQLPRWPRGTRWDVRWSDIWPELTSDNIPQMDTLHGFYQRRTHWHGCWGRKICLRLRRELRTYGLEKEL